MMKNLILAAILLITYSGTAIAGGAVAGLPSEINYYGSTMILDGNDLNFPAEFDGSDMSVRVQTENAIQCRVSIEKDGDENNLAGFVWHIEAPSNQNATLTLNFPKSALPGGLFPENCELRRVHEGVVNIVPRENVEVVERENHYEVIVSGVDEFSSWGLFTNSIPSLPIWGGIALILALSISSVFVFLKR